MKIGSFLSHATFCAILLAPYAAPAHTLPISTLTLLADKNYLHLELTLNPFELTFFSELDANHDGRLDPGEWDGQGEQIARRILEGLKLRVDDRLLTADIAGLAQSYESHHIAVRAHFPADARRARFSLESQLGALTSGSHVTQVTFGAGEHLQAARLDMTSNKVTFELLEPAAALGSTIAGAMVGQGAPSLTVFKANETAVTALLGLLFLAGIPPVVFCVLLTRHRTNQDQVAGVAHAVGSAGIH